MSDQPPEGSNPPEPAGSSQPPAAVSHWAVPAVPPAPEVDAQPASLVVEAAAPAVEIAAPTPGAEVPPWANDPAVSRVPAQWAGSPAGAPTPPQGWYAPITTPPPVTPPHGWYPPVAAPPALAGRPVQVDRARWLPTFLVAAIVAGVVLGGIGIDAAVAAPSAGTVAIGDAASMTAAPGWVLVSAKGDTSQGIELQKANAILTAQVVSSSYSGDSASMVADAKQSLGGDSAQISYGDSHHTTIGGHDTTYLAFEAVLSGQHSGVIAGELVCMLVQTDEIIIVVAAPQGHFDPVVDDVAAMLKSVRVGQ
jgi:hypothetical protein